MFYADEGRIHRLKEQIDTRTEDIRAYQAILTQAYTEHANKPEIWKKALFLERFAEEIPIIVYRDELLIGSMRFWQGRPISAEGFHGNLGHVIVDYELFLQIGIQGIKTKIEAIQSENKHPFLLAVNAFSTFIRRYADKAVELSRKEADTAQKENLRLIAENCRLLSEKPPQTFWQAVQLVWFIHVFLHAEGMSAAVSFGRFDQYLYPFYQRDLAGGVLNAEQAKELLRCFWLKTCEGDESQNLTVGGNVENALSLLCMDVTAELCVRQPSLSVRIGPESSEVFWQKTIHVIKSGLGMPAIFHDDVVIKSLLKLGLPRRDAENYAIVGCYEANPSGNALGLTVADSLLLHEVLLNYLFESPEPDSFEIFYRGFQDYFVTKYRQHYLETYRKRWIFIRTNMVSPFESICFRRCLETGLAAEMGGTGYTMFGVNVLGLGTLVDSLYVVKTLVFDEKAIGYSAFVQQVKQNFPDRLLAERCKRLPGKYGTDSAFTNRLAAELSQLIAETVICNRFDESVIAYPGLFYFLQDVYSKEIPATPDGRLHGERLSYGIAASDFCSGKTVTSVLNAASCIANDWCACGNPVSLCLPKTTVEGEKGTEILKSLIKGYFSKGGFHLQINVADADLLREAQAHPEQHEDLLIRVSGYSAQFIRLDDVLQQALIERASN